MREWSLVHTKIKKIWFGLTLNEVCIILKLIESDQDAIYIHKQGDTHWTDYASALNLIAQNPILFDQEQQPQS